VKFLKRLINFVNNCVRRYSLITYASHRIFSDIDSSLFFLLLAGICRTNCPSLTVPERRYGAGVMVDTRPAWLSLWT